jgi:hypothetical protein
MMNSAGCDLSKFYPCHDPLLILQYYLASLDSLDKIEKEAEASSSPSEIGLRQRERDRKRQQQEDRRRDEILRTADFLFGGSILEGALAVLDSGESLVTRVVSISSQRSLYLVKGSSSSSQARSQQQAYGSSSLPAAEYYLCLVPNENEALQRSSSSIFYCSCRSFLERSRSSTASSSSSSSSMCKHLLALSLMTCLGVKAAVVETVSDEEFSNFVVSRLGV